MKVDTVITYRKLFRINREAEFLLMYLTGLSREKLMLQLDNTPSLNLIKEFYRLVALREKGHPLQYILGEWDFMGLTFKLSPSVLIPRPETELLVEETLKRKPHGGTFLDVGTGSGNIACSIAYYNDTSQVIATDINYASLILARDNALRLGVSQRISFVFGNLFTPFPCNKFDIIVSNPPYVPTSYLTKKVASELSFEPQVALDGGDDGLLYIKQIIKNAGNFLRDDGWLFLEIGDGQTTAITDFADTYWEKFNIIPDYNKMPRIFWAKGYKLRR